MSSPFAYAMYGLILCGVLSDIETGYQLGELALNLLAHLNARPMQAKTWVVVYTNIKVWKVHIRETLNPLQEAHQAGLVHGDFEFSGYAALNRCYYLYATAYPLKEFQQELQAYIQIFTKLNQCRNLDTLEMYLQITLNLTQPCNSPENLIGKAYNEDQRLPLLQQANDRHALFHFYLQKLILCYSFEKFEQASRYGAIAAQYLDGVVGLALITLYYFYDSLAQLALYSSRSTKEQDEILKHVAANQAKLQCWAQHAPMNYLHRWYLVEAERYRVLNQETDAINAYDTALSLAEKHEYIQDAALICELCTQFYLNHAKLIIAKAYLQEAQYYYRQWGAVTKVQALEARYSSWVKYALDRTAPPDDTASSLTSNAEILDLATVMKASQAITSELVLHKLLSTLLRV
ncbi:MAG TPA: serine/threonine protein kinase, partial [Allocoleopsis sp.]